MKMMVMGSTEAGYMMSGKMSMGQDVVVSHKGKVEQGTVVSTKTYTKTNVSFDNVVVMLKKATTSMKGPMSKGLEASLMSLASQSI